MELGDGPLWYQPGPKPHVNPPNLGYQTLRLRRVAAPFTIFRRASLQLDQIFYLIFWWPHEKLLDYHW